MLSEENKKSEPFSYREKVRIFMVWCDREDSNLWPSGSEYYGQEATVTLLDLKDEGCRPLNRPKTA